MVDLFTYEGGKIVINNANTLAIPEYRRILDSDTGSPIDPTGTLKVKAFNEFLYIYLTIDYRSPYIRDGLQEAEIIKRAKLDCNFHTTWTPSGVVQKAIERYRSDQEQSSLSIRVYKSLLKGLNATDKLIGAIVDSIHETLATRDITTLETEGKSDPISIASNLVDKLLKLSSGLPKAIKEIQAAEEAAKKDLSDVNVMKGGQEIPDSARPENA